jgi:hypothetical protein
MPPRSAGLSSRAAGPALLSSPAALTAGPPPLVARLGRPRSFFDGVFGYHDRARRAVAFVPTLPVSVSRFPSRDAARTAAAGGALAAPGPGEPPRLVVSRGVVPALGRRHRRPVGGAAAGSFAPPPRRPSASTAPPVPARSGVEGPRRPFAARPVCPSPTRRGGTCQGRMVPGRMVPGRMVPGRMVPGRLVPGRSS